jgi:phospholipid/cholesterol/gamma-HCH transport system permease protein
MSIAPNIKIFLEEAGGISRFAGRFLNQWFRPRYEFAEFIRQCFI